MGEDVRVREPLIVFGLVAALSGCASGPAVEPTSSAAAASSAPVPSGDVAEATCSALSEPVSLSFNAWNDFQKGTIDVTTRNEWITRSADLFRSVDAPEGDLRTGTEAIVAYIGTSTPTADGQLYDPGSDEFSNLVSQLGLACTEAGHTLTVNGHGG